MAKIGVLQIPVLSSILSSSTILIIKKYKLEKELVESTIVGQNLLSKEVERIFDIFAKSHCEIRPHFILTGESGSGKTFTIKSLAEKHQLNFLELNAAQLTKEGVSGNSLSKALAPMINLSGKPTIVFVDEFDKLFISGNSNSSCAHESTTGVQNEFLKVLESDTASVFGDYGKFISVAMKNTLFIFAGAFNNEADINLDRLREIGIKTEFLGRVGLVYNTKKLELDDLYYILENSKLLTNYLELFKTVKRDVVINEIKNYLKDNFDKNTLGARMVTTLINQYFIKGGLSKEETKKVTFQNHLEF